MKHQGLKIISRLPVLLLAIMFAFYPLPRAAADTITATNDNQCCEPNKTMPCFDYCTGTIRSSDLSVPIWDGTSDGKCLANFSAKLTPGKYPDGTEAASWAIVSGDGIGVYGYSNGTEEVFKGSDWGGFIVLVPGTLSELKLCQKGNESGYFRVQLCGCNTSLELTYSYVDASSLLTTTSTIAATTSVYETNSSTTSEPAVSTSSSSTTSVGEELQVISVTPVQGKKNVDWEEPGISARFNKPLDPKSISAAAGLVEYVCCSAQTINGSFSVDPGDSSRLIFTPASSSEITGGGWNIRVTIRGGGVKGTAGEKLAADYVWNFFTTPSPTIEIVPVQVIDGMDLVQNKEAVVRVKARWAGDVTEVPAKVRLIYDDEAYSVENESAVFYSAEAAAQHPGFQRAGSSVNFYSRNNDVPVIQTAGSHTIQAIVEPTDQNIIPPKTFTATLPVKVRAEKTFRVIYYPINSRLTSNMWNDTGTDFDTYSFSAVLNNSNQVIRKLYPVTNAYSRLRSSTIYNILPAVPEPTTTTDATDQVQINLHLKWILFALANLNRNGAYDAVVGVVPRPWLDRLLGAVGSQQNILPWYFTTYACLIVHNPGPQISPHEIGHIYLQTNIPNCDAEGHDPRNVTFTGYDLARNRYIEGRNAGWQTGGLYSSTLMDTGVDGASIWDVWISRDSYQLLENGLTTTPWFSSMRSAQAATAQVIQVIGHVSIDTGGKETATLQPVYVLNSAVPTASSTGEYAVELQSAAGAVLKSCSFALDPGTIEDGTKHDFFLINLEDDPAGVKVVVRHNTTVLATAQKSKNAPAVTITSPTAGKKISGSATFTWQASDSDGDALFFDILYSSDNGSTWDILEQNVNQQGITVDTTELPGGSFCRIKVTANDGFNTTEVVSDAFTVANAPLVIATSPAASAVNVPPEMRIAISFRDPMDAATITADSIVMQDSSSAAVTGTTAYNENTREALFIPGTMLEANKTYTVRVTTKVKNTQGATLGSDYTFSFTTGERTLEPEATTTIPGGTTTTTASGTCPAEQVCGDGCCSDEGYPNCCIIDGEAMGCCSNQYPYCGYNDQGEVACFSSPQTGEDECEINGWYGDGECDDFCPKPDPDCTKELCPVEESLGEGKPELAVLRFLRDGVLAENSQGQNLVHAYYKHAAQVSAILAAHPDLKAELLRLVALNISSAADLALKGHAVVQRSTVRELLAFIEELQTCADAEAAADLSAVKTSMQDGSLLREINITVSGAR